MGIQGLLRALSPLFEDCNIKDFRGKTFAIDGFSWLHKGTYGCAWDLCMNKPTQGYINYILRRCGLLSHHGVTPLVVFDGAKLEAKAGTNDERAQRRKECLKKGKEIWKRAQKLKRGAQRSALVAEANNQFQQGVRITSEMVMACCKALKKANIRVIVAPFEADAQLAYTLKVNLAQGIISEDSDIICFALALGVNAPLFTKMDKYGNGKMILMQAPKRMHDTYVARYKGKLPKGASISKFISLLRCFDCEMFIQMCVLSGCDYVSSVSGVGLFKSQAFLLKYRTEPAERRVEKIVKELKRSKKPPEISENYVENVKKSVCLFYHQRVYDPITLKLAHSTPLSQGPAKSLGLHVLNVEGNCSSNENVKFLGHIEGLNSEILPRLAEGEICIQKFIKLQHSETNRQESLQKCDINLISQYAENEKENSSASLNVIGGNDMVKAIRNSKKRKRESLFKFGNSKPTNMNNQGKKNIGLLIPKKYTSITSSKEQMSSVFNSFKGLSQRKDTIVKNNTKTYTKPLSVVNKKKKTIKDFFGR